VAATAGIGKVKLICPREGVAIKQVQNLTYTGFQALIWLLNALTPAPEPLCEHHFGSGFCPTCSNNPLSSVESGMPSHKTRESGENPIESSKEVLVLNLLTSRK